MQGHMWGVRRWSAGAHAGREEVECRSTCGARGGGVQGHMCGVRKWSAAAHVGREEVECRGTCGA